MTQIRSRKTPGNICLSFVSKNGAARKKKRRTRRRREKTEKTDREKLGWEKDYLQSSKVANPLKHGWQCGKWANSLVALFSRCRSPRPKWRELFIMCVHKCFAAFITMIRWKKREEARRKMQETEERGGSFSVSSLSTSFGAKVRCEDRGRGRPGEW